MGQFHTRDELAQLGLAGNEGDVAGLGGLDRLIAQIQAQVAFAMCRIRAVAMKALFIEDGPHIAVVFQFGRLRREEGREGQEDKEGLAHGLDVVMVTSVGPRLLVVL